MEVFAVDNEQTIFYISIYDKMDKAAFTLLYKYVVEKEENITLPKITVVLVIRNSKKKIFCLTFLVTSYQALQFNNAIL